MPKASTIDDLFQELRVTNQLLRALIAITSAESGLAGMSTTERVLLLYRAGLKPSEIAMVLGLATNNVTARLSELRKRAKVG